MIILCTIAFILGILMVIFRKNLAELFAALGVFGVIMFYLLIVLISVAWPVLLIIVLYHFGSKYW